MKRPVIDTVVLTLTVTVCALLLVSGTALSIAAVINPTNPALDRYLAALGNVLTGMVGAVLGLLAGRGGRRRREAEPDPDA